MSFLPPYLLTETVNVLRRANYLTVSRNALNDPSYGSPETWNVVYYNMNCRLSFSNKDVRYAPTGELIAPTAELIYDPSVYTLYSQDHIVIQKSPGWPVGVEYSVDSVYISFYEQGIPNHGMCRIRLPIV
jgi:hypothetical protein